MRWHKIIWKDAATFDDRLDALRMIFGTPQGETPPYYSGLIVSHTWINEIGGPL